MKLFIFLMILFVFDLSVGFLIRKKLGIKWEFPYKHVNKTHKIVEIVIMILTLGIYAAALFIANRSDLMLITLFSYFTLLTAFRAFMEWKYDKESKRYILSLFDLVCGIVMIIGILAFLPAFCITGILV